MTNEPKKILFVCTGNICRSPVAQFLAERLAREAGLPLQAASAGVEAELGRGMEPGARRALAARGIKGASHLARQLDEAMLAGADAAYALTRSHKDVIVARFPAHAAKVAVLREAAGLPDPDVADPYAEPDEVYEACAARIEEALKILIRRKPHAEDSR
ncbi:MAG TPA: low molecular weight protein arginine phosphatase [Elusimicrobiota bacterium]|jgi:protein-tyrosine-phosphatase|nr:low molecular weight protein arginine phosphatase [Elusimicrobiota bacterium]